MAKTAKKTSQYKVIIERGEDGFFVASVPLLPGCHTQGKTRSELTRNIKDVILMCLEHAKADSGYRAKIAERAREGGVVGIELVSV